MCKDSEWESLANHWDQCDPVINALVPRDKSSMNQKEKWLPAAADDANEKATARYNPVNLKWVHIMLDRLFLPWTTLSLKEI